MGPRPMVSVTSHSSTHFWAGGVSWWAVPGSIPGGFLGLGLENGVWGVCVGVGGEGSSIPKP